MAMVVVMAVVHVVRVVGTSLVMTGTAGTGTAGTETVGPVVDLTGSPPDGVQALTSAATAATATNPHEPNTMLSIHDVAAVVLARGDQPDVHRETWVTKWSEIGGGPVLFVGDWPSCEVPWRPYVHLLRKRSGRLSHIVRGPLSALREAASRVRNASAFFVVDYWTYVIPEHVERVVRGLSAPANEPMFVGYAATSLETAGGRGVQFAPSEGGFLLSRAALDLIPTASNSSHCATAFEVSEFRDARDVDVAFARCLYEGGVSLVHEPRFFPVALSRAARCGAAGHVTFPLSPAESFPYVRSDTATLVVWEPTWACDGVAKDAPYSYRRLRRYELDAMHVLVRYLVVRGVPPDFASSGVVFLVPANATSEVTPLRLSWVAHALLANASVAFVGECAGCDYALPGTARVQLDVKVRRMLVDALDRFPHAKWFVKLDVDTLVVPENVLSYLSALDPTYPHYFGWTVSEEEIQRHLAVPPFPHGGPGYVFSRAALESARGALADNGTCPYLAFGYEDVGVSSCVAAHTSVRPWHSLHFTLHRLASRFGLFFRWNSHESVWRHTVGPLPRDVCTLHGYKHAWDLAASLLVLYHVRAPPSLPLLVDVNDVAMPRECVGINCTALGVVAPRDRSVPGKCCAVPPDFRFGEAGPPSASLRRDP